jgi:ABC-type polysaccharide/polyol phosphate transport system ATPase subunit
VTSPISLTDVGKRYTKYDDTPMLVTAALRFRRRTRRSKLWAVRHVDLDVPQSHCVGVIGRNGSGKSTLLQMVAGVTAPTEGVVRVRGRVAPLISVGVGFHPELTGRENVFVNGTILGLTRREIEQRLDGIIAFADIGGFVDTPVKFYSSGMFVRLGFSVAIHAEPEVLLVDEVLAVGDLAFQFKCFERMMEIRESGTTILVVSHNLNAVRKMCDRTMVLHAGVQRFDGATSEAISLFHELIDEEREIDDDVEAGGADADGKPVRRGVLNVLDAEMLGADGRRTGSAQVGERVTFRVETEFLDDIDDPVLGISIANAKNVNVYSEGTITRPLGSFRAGERVTFEIPLDLRLVTGSYSARIGFTDPTDMVTRLGRARPFEFFVTGRRLVSGVADLEADFVVQRDHEPGGAVSAGS